MRSWSRLRNVWKRRRVCLTNCADCCGWPAKFTARGCSGGPRPIRRQLPRRRRSLFTPGRSGCAQRLASERDADKIGDLQTVLGYLEKYRDKLLGHVIPRADGTEPFVVERTNNVSEHRFGTTKQGLRRKVGTKKLTRLIQAMRPEELLIANLDDPEYLEIVCGGNLENLPALFAQNWKAAQAIRTERRKRISNHPIPIRKKILRDDEILARLKRAVDMVIAMTRGNRHAA